MSFFKLEVISTLTIISEKHSSLSHLFSTLACDLIALAIIVLVRRAFASSIAAHELAAELTEVVANLAAGASVPIRTQALESGGKVERTLAAVEADRRQAFITVLASEALGTLARVVVAQVVILKRVKALAVEVTCYLGFEAL
jgi:hypothetical protein